MVVNLLKLVCHCEEALRADVAISYVNRQPEDPGDSHASLRTGSE